MADRKKYRITTSLTDDAPHDHINWYTISFLTPDKIDKTKCLQIKGFKIHNGYNAQDIATDDIKKIKEQNNNHDIYLAQMGKIYAWDDPTKTDDIEYNNKDLNNMERNRREQIDKIKLLKEQVNNEQKKVYTNDNFERLNSQKNRLRQKLYQKGLISKDELQMIENLNAPVARKVMDELNSLQCEIDEAYETDYLDENPSTGLKFGCLTIYSPKQIGGLKNLCFKMRGLYQTKRELEKRLKFLETNYPEDTLYQFELGKWCAYTDQRDLDPLDQLKQMNFYMKVHLENMSKEQDEFEARKESMMKTDQPSSGTNNTKKKKKQLKKRETEQPKEEKTESTMGNKDDDEAIQNILKYLDDPELKNKFAVDASQLERVEVGLNE